ncbi:hypothetical protein B0H14DRAFT_2565250 [Mycena olivaceomarginata]|nr:hypothetical protein B0H14DRAFT_2565250 [Mycena olivaceomarginata]
MPYVQVRSIIKLFTFGTWKYCFGLVLANIYFQIAPTEFDRDIYCQTVSPLTAAVSMAIMSENHPVAVPSNVLLNSLTERVGYPSDGKCQTDATGMANINNDESLTNTLEVLGSICWVLASSCQNRTNTDVQLGSKGTGLKIMQCGEAVGTGRIWNSWDKFNRINDS